MDEWIKNNIYIYEGKWQFGGEFGPKISETGPKVAQNEWKKGQKRLKMGQNPRNMSIYPLTEIQWRYFRVSISLGSNFGDFCLVEITLELVCFIFCKKSAFCFHKIPTRLRRWVSKDRFKLYKKGGNFFRLSFGNLENKMMLRISSRSTY